MYGLVGVAHYLIVPVLVCFDGHVSQKGCCHWTWMTPVLSSNESQYVQPLYAVLNVTSLPVGSFALTSEGGRGDNGNPSGRQAALRRASVLRGLR